jgi:hypothetical protein
MGELKPYAFLLLIDGSHQDMVAAVAESTAFKGLNKLPPDLAPKPDLLNSPAFPRRP